MGRLYHKPNKTKPVCRISWLLVHDSVVCTVLCQGRIITRVMAGASAGRAVRCSVSLVLPLSVFSRSGAKCGSDIRELSVEHSRSQGQHRLKGMRHSLCLRGFPGHSSISSSGYCTRRQIPSCSVLTCSVTGPTFGTPCLSLRRT